MGVSCFLPTKIMGYQPLCCQPAEEAGVAPPHPVHAAVTHFADLASHRQIEPRIIGRYLF